MGGAVVDRRQVLWRQVRQVIMAHQAIPLSGTLRLHIVEFHALNVAFQALLSLSQIDMLLGWQPPGTGNIIVAAFIGAAGDGIMGIMAAGAGEVLVGLVTQRAGMM